MTDQPGLLALWCVPRSRSTAFERAMYERGDLLVVHEPFSRVCDFGEAEVAGRTCASQEEVMTALTETAADRPVFFKDTTDFRLDRLGARPDFLRRCRHAAMVRNPRDTVRSHLVMQADATSPAMGFGHLWDIVSTVTSAGHPMHLVDGDRVAGDPETEMRRYCAAMGIEFLASSLDFRKEPPASWKATERWHAGASESNALGAAPAGRKRFPEGLEEIALAFERDQLPYYERITAALGGATR
ncbi:sulfotransferase family protein [Streptomyces sp. NBC_00525]|uniref:sulfotransferase family protein n=1 Tax=Streptomyces sp. NBC_00525 TaxID=2903660 RepID=UPI002E8043D7|nr:sulfotransferase family protein [Streptomyces sp. NBC_00525]WUC97897.1 sulfotransferase family protein [Streptomyces sp. NBC_00525]